MPLDIDIKMIRSLNCSDWLLFSAIVFWISRRSPNIVVCPGTTFHSNSSTEFSVDSVQFTIFTRLHESFYCSFPGFYRIKMFMNSAKTKPRIRVNVHLCFRQLDRIVDIPNISSFWFRINFCELSNTVLTFSKSYSWLYSDSLGNLVQDVLPPS